MPVLRRPRALRPVRLPRALSWAPPAVAVLVIVSSSPVDAAPLDAERVAGDDRWGTAVAISQQQFPTGSAVVVLVDGLDFPDALTAAPAAGALSAPVLPVRPTDLPDAVRAEIVRLHPTTALVVGGTGAVADSVVNHVQQLGVQVARVSGEDRYATAARIAMSVVAHDTFPQQVLIASGTVFADGLVGGAYGAATGAPLLLTDPRQLPAVTAAALTTLRPSSVVVLGGTAAVSDAVLGQLRAATPAPVNRVSGDDRYGTAAAVEGLLWQTAPAALVASGTTFPDALAAGALGLPLLLSQPGCRPASTQSALAPWATGTVIAVGGTMALSDAAQGGVLCS